VQGLIDSVLPQLPRLRMGLEGRTAGAFRSVARAFARVARMAGIPPTSVARATSVLRTPNDVPRAKAIERTIERLARGPTRIRGSE